MAKSTKIKVIDQCKIFAPQNSAPTTILPLTFLDIPWLFFSPSKTLFFYEYPHSTSTFLSSSLPNLKHSLSLALQRFFPFLGNLVLSSNGNNNFHKPNIVYTQEDYVLLTIQESSGEFTFFTSNHARDVHEFYHLVPELATTGVSIDQEISIPLLAIKISIFADVGICIGLAFHNVAADGRTFNNFIKAWASLCASSCFLNTNSLNLPSFDRSIFKDSNGFEEVFLKELWKRKSFQEMVIGTENHVDLSNVVRATFVVSLLDMEKIKNWIIGKCKRTSQPLPIHLSPYVLTCSFIWVCLVKAQSQMGQVEDYYPDEDPNYFGFIAGGLTRLDYPVPAAYFGNCVGFGRGAAIRRELKGENAIVAAANVIGNKIKKLDKEILDGAKKWISEWEVLFGSEVHVMIYGSPKLNLYDTDFGWGRPRKIEEISIDRDRAISLTENRDEKGGIDVGIALPKCQMEVFVSIFNEALKSL